MTAINYAFKEVTSAVTGTNTNYADVTGASLASDWAGATSSSGTGFTVGNKYLLLANAAFGSNTAGQRANLRILHGSTVFDGGEFVYFPPNVGNRYANFRFMTVWTAVSGEAIKLQNQSNGTATQTINFVSLLAIDLSSQLTENTDWFTATRTNDDALSTTPTDGASITFTPGTASHDWLVISFSSYLSGGNTSAVNPVLNRSGEASSTTPAISTLWIPNTWRMPVVFSRVFTLGAASNTFKEVSANATASLHTREHSTIFALNLHKFAWRMSSYTDTTANLSSTDYATQVATATIAPTSNTTAVIGSSFTLDTNHSDNQMEVRSQSYVDGGAQSDQPAGQTTANYQFMDASVDNTTKLPFFFLTAMSQTGGSTYRTDVDASTSATTNTPDVENRSLWGFSVELEAASGPNAPSVNDVVTVDEGTTMHMGLNIPLMKLT